jgi:hypothetical protein
MKSTPIGAEAQRVLDDLWAEKLLPFELRVGNLIKVPEGYQIQFYDSRISTATVPILPGQAFKDAVRAAVLDRVHKMSGPLGPKPR